MGPRLTDYWPFLPNWLPVYSYGFCIMIGFLTALFLACRRGKKVGLSSDDVMDLAFWAFLSGLAGARLLYVVQFYRHDFAHEPFWKVFALWQGGLVFYGGFLAAIGASFYVIRRKRMPIWRTLDVLASVVMLGLAFGRVGCFSRGCCWGVPTRAWWGVVFPPGAPPYEPGTGIAACTPLVPTQLISSFNAFLIFVVLSLYFHRWRRRDGEVSALLLILYPLQRFFIEFYRADTAVPGGLSVAQWISIPVALAAACAMAWVRWHPQPASEAPALCPDPGAAHPPAPRKENRSNRRRQRKRPRRPGA